jgi:hypothetical protein
MAGRRGTAGEVATAQHLQNTSRFNAAYTGPRGRGSVIIHAVEDKS